LARSSLEISDFELLPSAVSWVGLEPTDAPDALGRLGRYEIVEVIGYGGTGVVLKGRDQELNRFVAIKVLSPHLASSAAARKRFVREAQAAAAVVHPHVVAIHAVNADARLPYLVMQYVAGETLQHRLDERGPLDVKDTLRIGVQAARGLAAAHAQGLVHRDVKPANILLERDVDRALLTDFGLARAMDDASLTRSGVIAGTPQYMAPEQARGETVDARSDLFSLGSVLYTMCAGRPPFRAESPLAVLRRLSEGPPRPLREVNPDVPDWLERIIARLHAANPDERVRSAAEVAELLEQCLAHVQRPSAAPLPEALAGTGLWKKSPSERWHVAIGVAVAAALALVAMATLFQQAGVVNDAHDSAPVQQRATPQETQGADVTAPESFAWPADIENELKAIDRSIDDLERDLLEEPGN
jgi:serine/threonine-protein kinase